jgi:HD-GYP domain-containing protein (c-di-GMP phosphodiesterase class II)
VHEVISQHHERLDGTGYPAGLRADEISFAVRVVAVADVVEAMSTHRPYRPALGIDPALAEITAGKDIRYDGAVVEACVDLLQDPKNVLEITS